MKRLIILGSSRSKGNTYRVLQHLHQELDFDFLDLRDKDIGHFDYEFNNKDDDFLPIIKMIADNYDLILFATPVYWYSMSGILKTFFDRISDCLKTEKITGRKLRGKTMASLSCGTEPTPVEGFKVPFELSADYLGMKYLGHLHTWAGDDEAVTKEEVEKIKKFALQLS